MEPEALNWTAVIVGAVAGFAFGALVYNPKTLGTIWANGSGIDLESGAPPPVTAFVFQGLALLCLALVIGLTATISYLGTAVLAILAVLLFVVSGGAFARKTTGALAVDALYIAGAGALMIAAQGIL